MSYLSFDYAQFNEKGLKKVIDEFKRQDLQVTSVEADNKAKRQSGVQTKKATLHFADGQKLMLQATAQGAIFQVRLNTRVIPIKHVDDLKKAVAEIAGKVSANSKQFQQTLKKRAARASSTSKDSSSRAKTSLKAQIALANADKQDLEASVAEKRKQKQALEDGLPAKEQRKSDISTHINQEYSVSEQLEAELKQLEESAA
ncbi:hypothetical protein R8O05_21405 [Vibrio sp. 1865]|uniref:defense against restriction DarA-related protein n=1 Tax=Vibrio TaxID=662 RepID=UPI0013B8D990|nr:MULTISPECIES: hypothetical protein [Vibrio]MBY7719706.1 hypothetical protein [Vibrio parahaemolyticus]MDW2094093.1 hypothetical protein [Vibrio sp. 1866]MDW3103770.1 hypothetical protein [Vibrio sp. 1874]MDW3201872.1 hypothetical protein [Vibrio sp. 1865]NEU19186.1 hypothetical protein [Vibrio parahaemolyticus]